MKPPTKLFFIILWMSVCIFKIPIFPDKATQLYISFTLFTLIISGVIFFKAIRNKKNGSFMSLWLLCCIIWLLYMIGNGLFRTEMNSYYIVYGIASVLLVTALILYFREDIKLAEIYKYFVWLGLLESVFIVLQYFHVLNTDNIYSVSGTFHNPNIAGIYLTICTAFYFEKITENSRKKNNYILLGVLLFAIILTDCRTAFLGTIIIAGVYIFSNPEIRNYLRKLTPKLKYLISALFIALFIFSAFHLYQNKKDSADGRLLIWKVSLSMVHEKPITGYGYGFFDKNYNLRQAEYFAENSATNEEIQNARYVYMPYNDYLENLVYGGIIGLVFYLS